MRIAIITPGHLASNPRVVKEAQSLAESGHDVTVIHGRGIPWLIPEDEKLINKKWEVIAVPFGRACAGLFRHLIQGVLYRGAKILFRVFPIRRLAIAASSPIALDLMKAASRVTADLFIAHYVAALPAAVKAARQQNSFFAFDAEDFHFGDFPDDSAYDHEREVVRIIEGASLVDAAYVSCAAPGIGDAILREYGVAASVVLNTFPKRQAPAAPSARGTTTEPSVYWFSQTVGPHRGLECAIKAISQANNRIHLYLRGNVKPGYDDTLMSLARTLDVNDRLHFLPVGPANEMVSLCLPYDIGLVAETGETLNRRIALTNKQFTYLLAGLPVVMSDVPAHRQFAEDARGASFLFETEDPKSLANALDNLLGSRSTLEAARNTAWQLGQTRYHWEVEEQTLRKLVADIQHD